MTEAASTESTSDSTSQTDDAAAETETITAPATEAATVTTPSEPTSDTETEDESAPIEGEEQLGDAGKRALDRMKNELKQTKRELAQSNELVNTYKAKEFSTALTKAAEGILTDPSLAPALLTSLDATSDDAAIKEALAALIKQHPALAVKESTDPFAALAKESPTVPDMQPLPPDAINAATFGAQLEQLGIKTN